MGAAWSCVKLGLGCAGKAKSPGVQAGLFKGVCPKEGINWRLFGSAFQSEHSTFIQSGRAKRNTYVPKLTNTPT